MCGRYALTIDLAALQKSFPQFFFPGTYAPRYNIAPTQPILAIPNDGQDKADFFVWGLIPSWAKDPSIGSRLINARSETLAEKPSFQGAFKYRRCLIPADGFYEWKAQPGSKVKTPYFISLKTRQPFVFAGLWAEWQGPEGSLIKSCTILTTRPNERVASVHDRMPVILAPEDYGDWLDPNPRRPDELQDLLRPFPAEPMDAYPVSPLVNNPANEQPECLAPLG